MNRIVWLASYPKSGNTWLRLFLANFLGDACEPADINALDVGVIASSRSLFDQTTGLESSDLTEDEIESYRPDMYRQLAQCGSPPLYLKVHDAYGHTSTGEALIPADVTHGAIYLVRNPLDVAVSFANHSSISPEEAVKRLARDTMTLCSTPGGLQTQFRQRLHSWSGHVMSWLNQASIPVHLLRYEDMCLRPIKAFTAAIHFLGLPADAERISRAVAFSSFETLREQEQRNGFKERLGDELFFRQGRAGAWREVLTADQAARVIAEHGCVMRRLGYVCDVETFGAATSQTRLSESMGSKEPK